MSTRAQAEKEWKLTVNQQRVWQYVGRFKHIGCVSFFIPLTTSKCGCMCVYLHTHTIERECKRAKQHVAYVFSQKYTSPPPGLLTPVPSQVSGLAIHISVALATLYWKRLLYVLRDQNKLCIILKHWFKVFSSEHSYSKTACFRRARWPSPWSKLLV